MKKWIADLATTNFRIVVSISLAVLTVWVVLLCLIFGQDLQTEVVIALFAFEGSMLGIDVAQFSIKRNTQIITPPQTTAGNTAASITATITDPNPDDK